MYKNLRYPQSLWVHRQSAITGSTLSAASQQVCPAVVVSLNVPYWDFSADCCFIVKLSDTLCHFLYPILFCSGKIVLKCHYRATFAVKFLLFSECWSFLHKAHKSSLAAWMLDSIDMYTSGNCDHLLKLIHNSTHPSSLVVGVVA